MGCGASQELVDLSATNAGMTSGIGPINASQMGCLLKQKMFSFSGDDFDIKDHNKEVLFKVKGNALSIRDKMHITDESGNKVAVMQRKLLALRATFYIYSYNPGGSQSAQPTAYRAHYRLLTMTAWHRVLLLRYKPVFDGQESTEKDKDGEALYRYAFVEDQMATMLGRQIIKRFVTSNEQVHTYLPYILRLTVL